MKQITRMAAAEIAKEEIVDLLAFLGDSVQTDRERLAIQQAGEHITCRVLGRLGMFADSDAAEMSRLGRQSVAADAAQRRYLAG